MKRKRSSDVEDDSEQCSKRETRSGKKRGRPATHHYNMRSSDRKKNVNVSHKIASDNDERNSIKHNETTPNINVFSSRLRKKTCVRELTAQQQHDDDGEDDDELIDDEKDEDETANSSELIEIEDDGSSSRYPSRSQRPRMAKQNGCYEHRSGLRRSNRLHRLNRKRFDKKALTSMNLQRLPYNPVLENRRGRPIDRRRKLDHCSSSSSSSSSTSTSSFDNNDEKREIHSLRKDLRHEAKFERRKLKSLLKGRKELMPINITGKEKIDSSILSMARERIGYQNDKSSCADIDPMIIDQNVLFDQIGGLSRHIQQLKEMCLFPMMYPHLFEHYGIQPPKGVLFYGLPGTGKTLVARALANECSRKTQEGGKSHNIAFFMRKGADCMSKWVGESERQLRLLFDQAYKMRPSIIFFDEIDGLAPVRSTRQDQIHSSIVSTLLALMDGIDSRGEIIVIGATNRLNFIDPALRRPGRFDRELRFDLPDCSARRQILEIHTKKWPEESRPVKELVDWLADQCSGYCGADLKALCTEAVLLAMRTRYPHMYLSSEKLFLEANQIIVQRQHFTDALRLITPASRRDDHLIRTNMQFGNNSFAAMSKLILPTVNELFKHHMPSGYLQINIDINKDEERNSSALEQVLMELRPRPIVPAARLLLLGNGRLGQGTHFLPALIARLDHLPIFALNCERIFAGGIGGLPEEQISQIIRNVMQTTGQGTPVLLVMPDLDLLEQTLSTGIWKMLISFLNAFTGSTSVMLLAAVQARYNECSDDLKQTFHQQHTYEIFLPKRKFIKAYFETILEPAKEKPLFKVEDYPEPPKASLMAQAVQEPMRRISKAELVELEKIYQQMLRQFRIFLRDLLRNITREPRFKCFNLPVEKDDAEDYYEIITEPMCLSQMMINIDIGKYQSKVAFMRDIYLIRDNAIEYNPDKDMEHKQIRHAANALVDMAEALFENEMDDDFPEKLEEARQLMEEGKRSLNILHKEMENEPHKTNTIKRTIMEYNEEKGENIEVEIITNSNFKNNSDSLENSNIRRSHSLSSNSLLDLSLTASPPLTSNKGLPNQSRLKSNTDVELTESKNSKEYTFVLDENELQTVIEKATEKARNLALSVPNIECLGVEMAQIIDRYRNSWDRSMLTQQLRDCIDNFRN